MMPLLLLRLEGAAVFAVSVTLYGSHHGGWPRFVLLFVLPDLSMIGYVWGPRLGAVTLDRRTSNPNFRGANVPRL